MPPLRREDPKRRAPARPLLVAFAGAALVAAALISFSVIGGRGGESETAPAASADAATSGRSPVLRGIAQDGIALGDPKAPVTLVEYADLQCPYCAQWARDAFPTVVDEYVRTGRVRIVFRGMAFLGPDSDTALRAALAAGRQDRLWDVVHGLFLQQGPENAGWVTTELLRGLGHAGLDADRMLAETDSAAVERELVDADLAAKAAGVPGTPYFEAGPTGGVLAPLKVSGLDAETFTAELDRILAG